MDYSQLGKTANLLHRKWNQVVSVPIEHEDKISSVSISSNPHQIEPPTTDPYIDLFDVDRIKAVVDQKLEQAMFEKVN